MRPSTLVRLAVAGNRTDVLRTVLTVLTSGLAVIALLAAATVISIHGYADRYTNALLIEPGLRPGVMLALILVALPVLGLAGQCIRLGVPARDRRLAAFRLAGATPGQAVLIATAETAAASLLGSLAGFVVYLIGRPLAEQRDAIGRLRLPTDVLPPILVIAGLILLVPLLAATVGALLMRRVILTPLGVVRRLRDRGPLPWPGLLIVGGLVLANVVINWPADWEITSRTRAGLGVIGAVSVLVGVVLGTGWISCTIGRLLRRYGRGAATLLAGQRLITDPWSGSRTMGALLTAVFAGAVAFGVRAQFEAQVRADALVNAMRTSPDEPTQGMASDPNFYYGAIRLVMIVVGIVALVAAGGMLVSLAEGIVARRRAYAALTATGVPRRTLSAALLWQTMAPMVPSVLLAIVSGLWLIRLTGTDIDYGRGVVPIAIPVERLTLLGGGAVLAVLLAAGAGLIVLRSSTDLEELRV